MVDTLTPKQRSERMRSVKQSGTALEVLVRKELHRLGLRYRLRGCGLPGRPDLVFPKYKAVLFVHGCFWHAHDCRLGRRPSTNTEFWEQKARANRQRDARKEAALRTLGWRAFAECEVRAQSERENRIARLATALSGRAAAGAAH